MQKNRLMMIAAATVAAGLIAAPVASAAVTATGCVSGDLCLVKPGGGVVLVPSGGSASPNVKVVEIENRATTAYCDTLKTSSGAFLLTDIPLGSTQKFSPAVTVVSVSAVTPTEVCPG